MMTNKKPEKPKDKIVYFDFINKKNIEKKRVRKRDKIQRPKTDN
jgi:hypothetical protein